jgi:hypothetical protein
MTYMQTHYITWWNLENLFDSESANRPQWLTELFRRDLKGWDDETLELKLNNLSTIISGLNNGRGPDILGVCEVENLHVLELLLEKLKPLSRHYRILHDVIQPAWGIDVSIIYDAGKYSVSGDTYSFELLQREVPRNIFQGCFTTAAGNEIAIMANHWSARSEVASTSESSRIVAAQVLSHRIEVLLEKHGKNTPIVVMGDFNDQPFAKSLTDYALSCNSRTKVLHGQLPYLYNMMWPILGQRKGSLVYNSEPQLPDQILVSKGLLNSASGFRLTSDSAILEAEDVMTSGRYLRPTRFGRPSNARIYDPKGFSDHLPISILLEESSLRS